MYSYKFDMELDQINYWFLVVKANMNYTSFNKFWNGDYVQMSSEKDMVKMNLITCRHLPYMAVL